MLTHCVTFLTFDGKQTEESIFLYTGGHLPLVLVVLVAHGVVDGVVHHLLLHVHDFALPFKVHHDLLNLRQLQLRRN